MKFSANDLFRLRWSLGLFVLLLLAGIALVVGAFRLERDEQRKHRELSGELADIRARLGRAREEEREIRSKISRYQQLLNHGVIGDEQRLDWLEQIAQIKAARRLFDIEYEIAPQRPIEPSLLPEGATAGNYEIMASAMKLQIQLLHEGDLLVFLDDLRARVQAHLLVRACGIERLPSGQGIRPLLRAECEIDWITLREKK